MTLDALLATPMTFIPNERNTPMTTPDQDRALEEIFSRPDVLSLDIEVRDDRVARAVDQTGRAYLINPDGEDAQHAAAKTDPRYARGH